MFRLDSGDLQLGNDVQGLGRALGRVPGRFATAATERGLQLLPGRLYQRALAGLVGRPPPSTPLPGLLQLPLCSRSRAAAHTVEPLRHSHCYEPVLVLWSPLKTRSRMN